MYTALLVESECQVLKHAVEAPLSTPHTQDFTAVLNWPPYVCVNSKQEEHKRAQAGSASHWPFTPYHELFKFASVDGLASFHFHHREAFKARWL